MSSEAREWAKLIEEIEQQTFKKYERAKKLMDRQLLENVFFLSDDRTICFMQYERW